MNVLTMLINFTFYFVEIYVIGITAYLLLLTFAAYFFRKKVGVTKSLLNFVIVIPAHNESGQIETTIKSVQNTEYPVENYSIYVIADNCTDNTASISESLGAKTFKREDLMDAGKGQALNWFFKEYKNEYENFDIVVIIDADTLMHNSFLNEMSSTMSHPDAKVAQGFYGVSNPQSSWRTTMSSAALNVFHHVRPAGRNMIGGSAGLKGNGMAFKTEVLKKYGWPAFSIVEDIEFSMLILMDNIIVHYNPDAIVYGEMASLGKQAESQRKRWESGRFEIFKKYAKTLMQKFITNGKPAYIDAFMELFIPPLSVVALAQIVTITVSTIFYPSHIKLLTACLFATIFYVFSGQILKKAPAYVWLSIIAAPFFIIWKIPLYYKMARQRKNSVWERTKRESELDE